jgi:hypothetical protein
MIETAYPGEGYRFTFISKYLGHLDAASNGVMFVR